MSCEGGEPKLQRIKRYSLLIEPKYLFVLVDAAREAKSAVYKIECLDELFGLSRYYEPLRESIVPPAKTAPFNHPSNSKRGESI